MSTILYRPEIDGLRCIAVLSVIFYHAGFSAFSGGFIGVDIFFVISGYLITKIIYPEIQTRQFSFAAFYERRVRRIFPALFVMGVSTSIAALFVLAPDQLEQYGQSLVAMNLFLSNRFFYLRTGYFAPNVEEVPLLHTWSLSVEEQFYLVFPLLLLVVARWWPLRIRPALSTMLVLSFSLCVWRQYNHQLVLGFFSTTARVWELLLGAWLGIQEVDRPPGRARLSFAAVGLVLTLVPIFAFTRDNEHPGWLTLIPVMGTGLLLRHATPAHRIGACLTARPLLWVGLVSYSAYLWHQPVFAMALHATGKHPPLGLQLALIALTLALAYLSWRFVERPLRDRNLVGVRRVWTGAGLGTALLLSAGLVASATGGLPGRFEADFRPFHPIDMPAEYRHCLSIFPGYSANCLASVNVKPGEPVDWLVLGDSHAQAFAAGLIAKYPELRSVTIGRDGCLPFPSVERYDVAERIQCSEPFDRLKRQAVIAKNTVLVGRYAYYANASGFGAADNAGRRPDSIHIQPVGSADRIAIDSYANVLAGGLEAAIEQLKGPTHLHFLHGAPELGFHPISCLQFGLRIRSRQDCAIPRADVLARQGAYRTAVQKVLARHPDVTVVDPMNHLCEADTCTALVSGKMMYRDDDHLSLDGAAAVFDKLF